MAASVYAETEASDELRRIERLNKLQEESLGTTRRDYISTHDFRENLEDGYSLEALNASRLCSIPHTVENEQYLANQPALAAWNNAHQTLRDDGTMGESLEDIKSGQTHRARLSAELAAIAEGEDWPAGDRQEHMRHARPRGFDRPRGSDRSRGGGRGGRGGGNLGSRKRIPMGDNDEHSATEPSKRERLPTMETYNVRKRKMISGAAGAMTERFGFPRKQVTNTVASLEARPAMTFTKPVPKSSATNHKIPESRTYGPADSLPKKFTPAVLASPADFMAAIAKPAKPSSGLLTTNQAGQYFDQSSPKEPDTSNLVKPRRGPPLPMNNKALQFADVLVSTKIEPSPEVRSYSIDLVGLDMATVPVSSPSTDVTFPFSSAAIDATCSISSPSMDITVPLSSAAIDATAAISLSRMDAKAPSAAIDATDPISVSHIDAKAPSAAIDATDPISVSHIGAKAPSAAIDATDPILVSRIDAKAPSAAIDATDPISSAPINPTRGGTLERDETHTTMASAQVDASAQQTSCQTGDWAQINAPAPTEEGSTGILIGLFNNLRVLREELGPAAWQSIDVIHSLLKVKLDESKQSTVGTANGLPVQLLVQLPVQKGNSKDVTTPVDGGNILSERKGKGEELANFVGASNTSYELEGKNKEVTATLDVLDKFSEQKGKKKELPSSLGASSSTAVLPRKHVQPIANTGFPAAVDQKNEETEGEMIFGSHLLPGRAHLDQNFGLPALQPFTVVNPSVQDPKTSAAPMTENTNRPRPTRQYMTTQLSTAVPSSSSAVPYTKAHEEQVGNGSAWGSHLRAAAPATTPHNVMNGQADVNSAFTTTYYPTGPNQLNQTGLFRPDNQK